MNKLFKQFVAFAIATVMVLGLLPTAMAVETHDHQANEAQSSVQPFTSTEDLIEQVKAQLIEAGKVAEPEQADQNTVAAVERESDYSYDQAVTMITLGIFDNRVGTEGKIDTTTMNLSAETMAAVVEAALDTYSLGNDVQVEYVEENGVVTSVDYTMSESYAMVLDELEGEAAEAAVVEGSATGETYNAYTFPFKDVPSNHWARKSIEYLNKNGIVNGMTKTTYEPNTQMTRGMVVTMLWRLAGEPEPKGTNAFTDLTYKYYVKAINWAAENGVVNGMGDRKFAPDEGVTREQLVTMVYRYAKEYCGQDVSKTADLKFKDSSKVSNFAKDAVKWSVAVKIINGYPEDNTFRPANIATRAEFAKIMYTYLDVYHHPIYQAEVPATCASNGTKAHWKCNICGKLFADAYATIEVSAAQITIEKTGHAPAKDATNTVWNWVRSSVNDPEANPQNQADYVLTYNEKTEEIGTQLRQVVTWDCDKMSFTCAGCGKNFEVETTVETQVMDEDWIDNRVAEEYIYPYIEEKTIAYYMANGTMPSEEQQKAWAGEAQNDPEISAQMQMRGYQLYQDLNSTLYVGTTVETPGINTQVYELNATLDQFQRDWATLCAFNEDYPEYLGIASPYWLSKNTETSPLGAILYLTGQQEQPFIPNADMDYMVSMLTQAFMSYVMQYGYMLDAMIADVKALTDHDELDTIDKLLLTHDWLAENATFDMQSLVDITEGTSSGNDPIAMTAFGTLLNDQIAKDESAIWDGGVCLGYTAAYAMLVQHVMGNITYDETNGYVVDENVKNMIDFVQIKYLTNVAESSVAAGDSGFGDGDAMFNSSHYLNAVNYDGQWYYIDACYDDINVEVISQQRVETDGNVSHNSFMISPATWEEQYEGNFQFMDSLYDGKVWNRVPDGQGGYKKQDNKGNVYETEQAANDAAAADESLQMFYVYEDSETDAETPYSDTTYETAWFVSANSNINYDPETQYFYYTSGAINSYSSMKDMFDDTENGSGNSSGMSQEDMMEYKYAASAQDKIVRRPVGVTNIPENSGSMSMGQTSDSYAEVLFHFGYGTIGAEAQANADADADSMMGGSGGTADPDAPYYDLIQADAAYISDYPDLTHSTVVMDGKLYFNIGNEIYGFNLSIADMATFKIEEMVDNLELVKLKEYNEISYKSNGKRFTGMSFEASSSGDKVTYHPVAALNVRDVITWTQDANGNPSRNTKETLFVSIGTNLSNSYKDADGNAYEVEARNYNPDYYRFMEEEEETEDTNTNAEFMWCANIVEKMPVAEMLSDWTSGFSRNVNVGAYCARDSFSETRTTRYALTPAGTVKTVKEGTAQMHSYVADETEGTNICSVCLDAHDHYYGYSGAKIDFEWAVDPEDNTKLTATASVACEGEFCNVPDPAECTVTGPNENGKFAATATYASTLEATETRTLDQFNHKVHTYGKPVFNWNEDTTACTATFTCELGTDVCLNEDGRRVVTLDCAISTVTKEGVEEVDTVATVTGPDGETYTDAIHNFNTKPTMSWDEDVVDLCHVTYTCSVCGATDATTITATRNVTAATCTKDGSIEYIAVASDGTKLSKTEVITKLDHNNVAVFTWSTDYKTCTLHYECNRDGCDHVEEGTYDCVVTSVVTTQATCTAAGSTTYTATYTDAEGNELTNKQTVADIPATGHDFGEDGNAEKCDTCGAENPDHVAPTETTP